MSCIRKALLAIISNKESSPKKVHNAFAYLYKGAEKDRDFMEIVTALCEHHPGIAKEFLAIMPERFIPKELAYAVDGCR